MRIDKKIKRILRFFYPTENQEKKDNKKQKEKRINYLLKVSKKYK